MIVFMMMIFLAFKEVTSDYHSAATSPTTEYSVPIGMWLVSSTVLCPLYCHMYHKQHLSFLVPAPFKWTRGKKLGRGGFGEVSQYN